MMQYSKSEKEGACLERVEVIKERWRYLREELKVVLWYINNNVMVNSSWVNL